MTPAYELTVTLPPDELALTAAGKALDGRMCTVDAILDDTGQAKTVVAVRLPTTALAPTVVQFDKLLRREGCEHAMAVRILDTNGGTQ